MDKYKKLLENITIIKIVIINNNNIYNENIYDKYNSVIEIGNDKNVYIKNNKSKIIINK